MQASAGALAQKACRLPVGPRARAGAVRSQRALPRNASGHRGSRLTCAAAAQSTTTSVDAKSPSKAFAALAAEFGAVPEGQDRYKLLLKYASSLPPLASAQRTLDNRVMGCTSQTWVAVSVDPSTGAAVISGDSDSEFTRGFLALLVRGLAGMTPAQIAEVDHTIVSAFGLGPALLPRSRANSFRNLIDAIRTRARRAAASTAAQPFPSLVISADSLAPRGAFAELQATYLKPDRSKVERLANLLKEKKLGIVAHFYMDAEVQGVLTAAKELWPHIFISDSLVMADASVRMVAGGCEAIAVLGVDFMSENVRAILDDAGHHEIPVFRMSEQSIGCTLAEAAEDARYYAYLDRAATVPNSLHVVYINTSLRTKALADARVPTITCTSSNVLNTVLTAAAQVPDVTIWYGPDSFMGANLVEMVTQLSQLPDEDVAAVHPAHTAATLRALLPRLQYFRDGSCMVHELFAGDVVETVERAYGDAFLTAHFEVPGEMFGLAMRARASGMGVVGSTQNILDFVLARTQEALEREQEAERLRFVLGTETGMVTSIVDAVQKKLKAAPKGAPSVEVEIVFPVSSDALAPAAEAGGTGDAAAQRRGAERGASGPLGSIADLTIVPGPASGEGCSMGGGCASCPYMKMNSLQALLTVAERVGTPAQALLASYEPQKYQERTPKGESLAVAGCRPILHMRDFQAGKRLPEALVKDIQTRNRGNGAAAGAGAGKH